MRRLAILGTTAVIASVVAGCWQAPEETPDTEAGSAAEEAPVPGAPPVGPAPVLDETTALGLAAMPLACIDRPQRPPGSTGYLYEGSFQLIEDYEKSRAFYGCYDWHSAVNSTWAMVALLRRFPDLQVAPLITEKLRQHLSASAMEGELAFFEANPTFERPYGWAWLLALHAELTRLGTPEAAGWTAATEPLASHFVNGFIGYVGQLDYPLRVGTHASTTFALDLALEYARAVGDSSFEAILVDRARRLFADDRDCPLAYEPSAADFLSPCLTEAALMASIMPPNELPSWLDAFLPDPDTEAFHRLRRPARLAEPDAELDVGQQGAKSHLIGLAFTRAEALNRLASALPPEDPRIRPYRDTAADLASWGMGAMFDADYLGSHWIGTFAVRYLITLDRPSDRRPSPSSSTPR